MNLYDRTTDWVCNGDHFGVRVFGGKEFQRCNYGKKFNVFWYSDALRL